MKKKIFYVFFYYYHVFTHTTSHFPTNIALLFSHTNMQSLLSCPSPMSCFCVNSRNITRGVKHNEKDSQKLEPLSRLLLPTNDRQNESEFGKELSHHIWNRRQLHWQHMVEFFGLTSHKWGRSVDSNSTIEFQSLFILYK